MKKILITMMGVMLMLTNVVFAAQQVELNESYSVEQTRAAANELFTDDVNFYGSMHRANDPNSYTRRYLTSNLDNWILCVDQNGQGNVCALGMIVPDSTNQLALGTIGDVLLTIAIGADSDNYSFGSARKKLIYDASYQALHNGQGMFYCEETNRFYRLIVSHDKMNSRWYYVVKAYVR